MEEDLTREDHHNLSSPNLELIKNLSPRDVRYLVHAEEELSQTKVSKLFSSEQTKQSPETFRRLLCLLRGKSQAESRSSSECKFWLYVVIQAVVLFQVFKRIWPTRMSRQYFNLFDSVPYSEKLMGRPTTKILQHVSLQKLLSSSTGRIGKQGTQW